MAKKSTKRERFITLNKGGVSERRVPLSQIKVPDAWHAAMNLRHHGKKHEIQSDDVLETWRLAHDLLNALKEISK